MWTKTCYCSELVLRLLEFDKELTPRNCLFLTGILLQKFEFSVQEFASKTHRLPMRLGVCVWERAGSLIYGEMLGAGPR